MKENEVAVNNLLQELNFKEKTIWNLLSNGIKDKKSSFHSPSLCTIKKNKSFIRTLILRNVEETIAGIMSKKQNGLNIPPVK